MLLAGIDPACGDYYFICRLFVRMLVRVCGGYGHLRYLCIHYELCAHGLKHAPAIFKPGTHATHIFNLFTLFGAPDGI